MDITDIIGKGKAFEPPFRAIVNKIEGYDFADGIDVPDTTYVILDATGKTVIAQYRPCEDITTDLLFAHIAKLLNERWKNNEIS